MTKKGKEINKHNKQAFCSLGFETGLFFVFLRARANTLARTHTRAMLLRKDILQPPFILSELQRVSVNSSCGSSSNETLTHTHTHKHTATHQPDLRADEDVRHPCSPAKDPWERNCWRCTADCTDGSGSDSGSLLQPARPVLLTRLLARKYGNAYPDRPITANVARSSMRCS